MSLIFRNNWLISIKEIEMRNYDHPISSTIFNHLTISSHFSKSDGNNQLDPSYHDEMVDDETDIRWHIFSPSHHQPSHQLPSHHLIEEFQLTSPQHENTSIDQIKLDDMMGDIFLTIYHLPCYHICLPSHLSSHLTLKPALLP